MIMTIEEAKDVLRADGEEYDPLILPLLTAIPDYLEATTGRRWDTELVHPLAKFTAGQILIIWFDGPDKDRSRIIDGLLTALTALGRMQA